MNTLIVTSVPILCSKGFLRTVLPRGKVVGARLYMFFARESCELGLYSSASIWHHRFHRPLKMIPIPLVTSFELQTFVGPIVHGVNI